MDETSFLNRKHASNSPVTFFTCKCFAVLFFLPSRCVSSLIWSKGSTEKQPAVRTSSTRRQRAWKISSKVDTREARERSGSGVLARLGEPARRLTRRRFAARFFDQRQTFIIATPQETFKSQIAPRVLLEMSVTRAMSKLHSFPRRFDFGSGHGVGPRSNFSRTWVAQSIRKTRNKRFPRLSTLFLIQSPNSLSVILTDMLHFMTETCSTLSLLVIGLSSSLGDPGDNLGILIECLWSWRWLLEHTSKFLLDLMYLLRMMSLR